jgi:NADH dehydrogenase [ubiquinone] 1 alpha subcomplex assembly factor 7
MSADAAPALRPLILAHIAANGPMRLSDYMALCLLHPEHGYYTMRSPFGAAGDFITAPEISQMFGEMLGLCLAQAWLDQGAPQAFSLAELGPGRGTLMADVMRATRAVAGFHAAANLVLVEASAALQAQQAKALAPYRPQWLAKAEDLPDAPLFLLANEFFDALPIRQFHKEGAHWAEVVVGAKSGALVFGKTAPMDSPALRHRAADTHSGDIVELCPSAAPIMAEISARIAAHGGAALVIDYGAWNGVGDTFQALRAHGFADPLAQPGLADLTAHVDFAALGRAAAPFDLRSQYAAQGPFLQALGIDMRAALLAQNLDSAARDAHLAAKQRLTSPAEMGQLFKVLGLTPKGAPPLAGFDTAPATGQNG